MRAKRNILYIMVTIFMLVEITVTQVFAHIEMKPSMEIYFIEFEAKLYGDVTRENIETAPYYKILIYGKHKFMSKTIRILESKETSQDIDLKNIRLKVVINKEKQKKIEYIVDSRGVVLRTDSQDKYGLSEKMLHDLEEDILYFHGIVDQQPSHDPWPRIEEE